MRVTICLRRPGKGDPPHEGSRSMHNTRSLLVMNATTATVARITGGPGSVKGLGCVGGLDEVSAGVELILSIVDQADNAVAEISALIFFG